MTPLAERAVETYARFVSGTLVLFGLVGLLRTHFDGFADNAGVPLLSFEMNPLTNLIHLVVGIAGVATHGSTERHARYLVWVGAVFVPFGLLEFVLGDGGGDIFGRNDRTAVGQLLLGAVSVGLWAWSRRAGGGAPVVPRPEAPEGRVTPR